MNTTARNDQHPFERLLALLSEQGYPFSIGGFAKDAVTSKGSTAANPFVLTNPDTPGLVTIGWPWNGGAPAVYDLSKAAEVKDLTVKMLHQHKFLDYFEDRLPAALAEPLDGFAASVAPAPRLLGLGVKLCNWRMRPGIHVNAAVANLQATAVEPAATILAVPELHEAEPEPAPL